MLRNVCLVQFLLGYFSLLIIQPPMFLMFLEMHSKPVDHWLSNESEKKCSLVLKFPLPIGYKKTNHWQLSKTKYSVLFHFLLFNPYFLSFIIFVSLTKFSLSNFYFNIIFFTIPMFIFYILIFIDTFTFPVGHNNCYFAKIDICIILNKFSMIILSLSLQL